MNKDMNWKLRKAFTGNNTSDVQTINGYIAAGEDNDFSVEVSPVGKEYAAPLFIPRTNLLLQSGQFDTTWYVAAATATSGQTGYDGTSDAWLFTTTVSGASLEQSITSSGVVVFSMYAKKGTVDGIRLRIDAATDANAYFNLSSGSVHSFTGSAINASITDLGGGWHRCEVSANISSPVKVAVYTTDGTTAYDNGNIYIQDAQLEAGSVATEYIPTTTAAVTRDWSAFGRVQNQLPGISNGTHTHTGAASGGGIAATTLTGTGSGGKFKYEFDTLGVLTTLTADGAGSGYKVGDKLSIDTTEGHTIEFRLVEGSNAATVSVSMDATRPNKPIPFPVSKMRVEGLTDRRVLIMDQRSRYVFPKPTPYLLDTYEGATAAYSLRRLRSAYTGPAVRVRRASNNDELDIYFNGDGSLDTATLEAFCAGTDGFVKVWFDQGQEGNDATQTSTASQPQIVSSGSVVMENGEPALLFDGASSFLESGTLTTATQPISIITTSTSFDNTLSGGIISTNDANDILDFYRNDAGFAINAGTTLTSAPGVTYANNTQYLRFSLFDGGSSEIFVNGTSVVSGNAGTIGLNGTLWLGRFGGATFLNGSLQEAIVYASDQTSNRTAIESNINDFYSIYP